MSVQALWEWVGVVMQQQQVGGPGEPPVEAGLRDYILLITILVAFLEAAAQQIRPRLLRW